MKKRKYLIIFGIILGLLIVFFFYVKIQNKYINNIKNIVYDENNFYIYTNPYINYFHENSKCPKTIEESFVINDKDPDFKHYINIYFRDYLSKNKGFIQYVPLYNKHNMNIDGFLLISAGIDGRLNNHISHDDTLFIDKNYKPFNFYNTNNPYKLGDIIKVDTEFNILDYFFGKKDYLISYINCRDYYLSEIAEIYPLTELIQRIQNYNYFENSHKVSKQVYGYYGIIAKDTLMNNVKYIFFKNNNYLIRSKLHDTINFRSSVGDSIALVGLLTSFDPQAKEIEFNNCFLLDSIPNRF